MIRNIFINLSVLFALFLIAGCESTDTSPSDYMTFEDIRYIGEFPQTFSLNNATEVDFDIIGMQNFCIYDTLLIVSTTDKDGSWSFVSLNNSRYLGKFLSLGQGPYEFFQSPSVVRNVKFFKEKNEFHAVIYDFQKGKLYNMNISESMTNNRLSISTLKDSLPPFLSGFTMIDSAIFLCKEINNNETMQIRYVLNGEIKTTPPHPDKLNRASVDASEDFNILSTITKQGVDDNEFIVEMPIHLNYINIYTLDGSFGKTVCIGEKLDDIQKIQDKKQWERIYAFSDLRLFQGFWGVIRINEDMKTFQTKRKRFPVIMLFDLKGEPLAELRLDRFITSFDIDITNGFLYALDLQTDTFCKYDISDILKKITIAEDM
jgi:hypothetical protein